MNKKMKKLLSICLSFVMAISFTFLTPLTRLRSEAAAITSAELGALMKDVDEIADTLESIGISSTDFLKVLSMTDRNDIIFAETATSSNASLMSIENGNVPEYGNIIQPDVDLILNLIEYYDSMEAEYSDEIQPRYALDGNPPRDEAEQRERMEYINTVFNKEYYQSKYEPVTGKYLAYLYTSHYIDNYAYDRNKPNFDNIMSNIISKEDIIVYDHFFEAQSNLAMLSAFNSLASVMSEVKGSSDGSLLDSIKLSVRGARDLVSDEVGNYLDSMKALGIDSTGSKKIIKTMHTVYEENYSTVKSGEELIKLLYNTIDDKGVAGFASESYMSIMKIFALSATFTTFVPCFLSLGSIMVDVYYGAGSLANMLNLVNTFSQRQASRSLISWGADPRP